MHTCGPMVCVSHAVKLTPMMLGKLLFPEVGGLTIGVSYQLATPVS